jgi:V8-like Glu-specific endopeptidase
MAAGNTQYPDDTIVYVISDIGGEYFQGSGVLISPDEVLTASHVVYGAGVGAASSVTVAPGYQDGATPFGTATATEIHYNVVGNTDDTISGADSQYDYAVLHLSRSFAGLGTMGLETNFTGGVVNVSGYPGQADGALITNAEHVTQDPQYSLLDDQSIGAGSSGGPLWLETAGGPSVVGVTSSEANGAGSTGYAAQITTAAYDQIAAWVAQDDAASTGGDTAAPIAVEDTTTNMAVAATNVPYSGPVAGLQNEYINVTPDNLNIAVSTPDWFVHSGGGDDAIAVSSGTNVLDGGTGSNFLTGGSGTDTFFVDDRDPGAAIWSSVVNFHAGDAATIWGVTQSADSFSWVNNQGAAGYTGLTLHATAAGSPTASLTLVGFTTSDMTSGHLTIDYGTDASSGSPYLYIQDNF